MQTARRIVVLLLFIISSGGTDSIATSESSSGFAVNSTITISPLPKNVIIGKKQDVLDSQNGRNAVIDAVELIDPKASEQVLELIVKIAEHPAIWKQIHRVLETLEANNAAYSQRIDASRSESSWTNKRLERPGDKRNDVPDDKIAIISNTTSLGISPSPSLETAFQRWRDVLFAVEESHLIHPQLEASGLQPNREPKTEQDVQRWASTGVLNQPEQRRSEKNFEERLSEIEDELKKLTRLSRTFPFKMKHLTTYGRQQEKKGKIKTTEILTRNGAYQNRSADDDSKPVIRVHPKFQYHKVQNTTNQPGTSNLLGPNYWKKIASLKHNGSNPTSRRNSFVAVSITSPASDKHERDESLIANVQQQGMLATEPHKSDFGKPCKKLHNTRKQSKQRPLNSRQSNNKDQSSDYIING
ncbi:uncharacterized protein LOC130693626 [Daphnia carinata]|uniref:uncharacterized protein LOC130693626 n=1 Tax=Daphnia carinata TaxID=120202 RepID=UPI00257D8E80|nr:uncharacterized protein LOC130693626 [Daphnia carinata]